ncbi:hypothetical protein PISMIDRAFT_12200 [Pisolithus microcarpus 441]|uniref:Uncharacterized protein n=1 Tax=Pisolithus microcarpus 441 TaxID=765257 RepID=A0A0C9ZP95_9AGAM|nr:hypothetical protein BKA83DRAFT_12200 [Pisolithus microcarpus]KIK21573.1 hypothetical protein PISMIDRAFT_12200 [Pisolithus microcarpus 441]
MAAKLAKRGEEVAHLILFDPMFIPSSERLSLKSTDWTQRLIDRTSSKFPEIGDRWKNKLCIEIRKNLESMFDYEVDFYDGPLHMLCPRTDRGTTVERPVTLILVQMTAMVGTLISRT